MQISLSSRIQSFALARSTAEVESRLRDARPWIYRLALAITASPEAAEDVAQEALIRAARSTDKLKSVEEPKAWLRTVVVRCAITSLKKTALPEKVTSSTEVDPTESLAVRETLSRLDSTDRAVLALAHFEELSYAEIGQALEIPVGTVASRLHAAREAFRKEWRK